MTNYGGYRHGSRKKSRQRDVGMERAIRHIQEYQALARRLGPIVDDVREAFFGLSSSNLNRLFDIYGHKFGEKPESYARNTFDDWKSGKRKMSGQTAERLLNSVPKFLSFNQRYQMVSRLCDYHAVKRNAYVTISMMSPQVGLSELQHHVETFCSVEILKHLPDHVMKTATWLHDNDAVATRALLSQIDRERSNNARQVTAKELLQIRGLAKRNDISSVNKTIEFPTGTIQVIFKKPSLWERLFG